MPVRDDAIAARRRRRTEDTRRWRSRCRRGVELAQVEIGGLELDLAIRFGGLAENQVLDRNAVNAAIGRLLRKALVALLRERPRRR